MMDKEVFCDNYCPVPMRWVEFPKIDNELTTDCDLEESDCPFRCVDFDKVTARNRGAMHKVWNKRDPNVPPNAVYVGRPTKWGNIYVIGKPIYIDSMGMITNATREQVIRAYQIWIRCRINEGMLNPKELKGKDLVCWCSPKPCHADILLELANA